MNTIKFVAKENIKVKNFLDKKNISKRAITKLIKSGLLVNGEFINKNIDLKKDDRVEIIIDEEKIDYDIVKSSLDVLYEDSQIIIINKPYGITMNSKGQVNLSNYIAYYFKENEINAKVRLINRLDMNTSGIMLIAKNKYAQSYYQKQIEENLLTKKYIAVVEGEFEIDKKVKIKITYDKENKYYYHSHEGIEAITIFKTIEKNKKFSIIEAKILTGKTHQIRASLKQLNHPIIGDYLYGSKYKLDRFLLHSYFLEFNEFLTGKKIVIKSQPSFDNYLNFI